MGQLENERADEVLATDFAEHATEEIVRDAMHIATERLAAAETAQRLVRIQAIRALSTRGYSTREIADVVGFSKSAVSRHLQSSSDRITVHNVPDVAAIVRQSWSGLDRQIPPAHTLPLEAVEEQARLRTLRPHHDELLRALQEDEQPGQTWPYRLSIYKFLDPWSTRDSFARALEQSAWMSAAVTRAGTREACTLHSLWDGLRVASSVPEFDRLVWAIQELAEQDRCWIEFIEPPHEDQPHSDER